MARAAKGQLSASAQQHPCREEHPRGGGVPQETGREAQQSPDYARSAARGGKGDRSCGSRAAAGAGASLARSSSLVVPWFVAQTAPKQQGGVFVQLETGQL